MDPQADTEVDAIVQVLAALQELDDSSRLRVVDYVLRRLGTPQPWSEHVQPVRAPTTMTEPENLARLLAPTDIRTLREEKKPQSAIEMTALVAFYVEELAPPGERQDSISIKDMKTYFKQAQYPLPTNLNVTLAKTAAAGYLDSVARGRYRLNPVGYNMVAHSLPREGAGARPQSRKRAPTRTRKKAASSSGRSSQKSSGRK